ncbi:MAG: RluA family pseudouridine synthase, partial [Desulfosalsimonas sp.]
SKFRYQKPGMVYLALVHRLDRPVAGVIVFARTSKAASRLSSQFRSGAVKKGYLAVVEGEVGAQEGELVDYMERRGPTSRIVDTPTGKSRQARLYFKVIEKGGGRSILEIDLLTGRHHQIRAQLANMGFPVAGDLRYGASGPLPQRQIALFARKLSFVHPVGKQIMSFAAPLPAGWPWPGAKPDQHAPPWNWEELSVCLKKEGLF